MSSLLLGLMLLAAPAAAPASPPSGPPRAYVGIYVSDVSGFDLREGRFQADLDVWLKWSGSSEPPNLRFVNGEIASRDEEERESDGDWHSIRWRVQGTFRGTFPLQDFPFDRQELRIELAVPVDAAHLSADLGSSGMAERFSITGWEYEPFFRAEQGHDVLPSDLGSIKHEGGARTLESVKFIVDLRRPATSNILKFMLPLAIILTMAFLVFALPPRELEVRSAMGVTALLSVVAFHFAMSDSLPDVPYLVAADRLFLSSYFLVLLSILETVIAFRMGEGRDAATRRLDRAATFSLTTAGLLVAASVITLPMRLKDASGAVAEEPPAPVAVSAREELVVGVNNLASLHSNGLGALLRRGLTHVTLDGSLVPHLAEAIPSMTDESVRLLPDGGMRVRWRLRPSLFWSDGAPLTARDLVYSLGLIPDPDRAEVTMVDERTLYIRYRRRLADALSDFPLFPEHAARPITSDGGYEALQARNRVDPVPSDGPYRVVSFRPNEEAVFERNPYFHGPPPAIGRIRVKVLALDGAVDALRTGSVQLFPQVPAALGAAIRELSDVALYSSVDENLLFLQPDLSVPLLADPRVRRAILHALDREPISHAFADGSGRIARTFRPDDSPEFAPDAVQTPHSLADARRLFAEVGGAPSLRLTLSDQPVGSSYARAAELVTRQLQAAGLKIETVVLPSSSVFQLANRGDHGGLLLHSRRDKRPARYFNLPVITGSLIDTRTPRPHFPPELVEAYQQYETSLFPERRRLLSMRLQRAFAETLPIVPLAFGMQLTAHARALDGFEPGQSRSSWWNVERWTLGEPPRVAPAVSSDVP